MTKEDVIAKVIEIFNELNIKSVKYLCMHCVRVNTALNYYRIDIDISNIDLTYEYPVGVIYPTGLESDKLKNFLVLNDIKIEQLNLVHEKMSKLVEEVSLNYRGKWFSKKCTLSPSTSK